MSRMFRQFSLKGLFLFLTIFCVGARVISLIVDLQQRAAAEHRQCENFMALTMRFPTDDRVNRLYCGERAYRHSVSAAEYDWAVYHPWVSLNERPAPAAPPAIVRMMKALRA
ncbi:MAG: hypothetical protein ACR2FY_21750 [Pirellulaceae bacterium]